VVSQFEVPHVKFDELRSKTDQQLLRLVSDAVSLGIREASEALVAADARGLPESPYFRAKQAYAEASRLMRLTGQIPEHERRRWEAKLEQLREMLEGLSILASTRPPVREDRIPTLARALWEARGRPEGSPEDDWFRAERALQSQPACVG
jgi:hypothetical protein